MTTDQDFPLSAEGPLTKVFTDKGIFTFSEACRFVHQLPYRRNADKKNIFAVTDEGCGTCSTKHILLFRLARENNAADISLMQCSFPMGEATVPGLGQILELHGLGYIPEKHNFLLFHDRIIDCTSTKAGKDFLDQMSNLEELSPEKVLEEKEDDHRRELEEWSLNSEDAKGIAADELWRIREKCIARLSDIWA